MPELETALAILNKEIPTTLSVDPDYIPLRAAPHANMENYDFDLDEHIDEFFTKERKVMLMLGDSGAGKSVYAQFLMARLWKSYIATPQQQPLPLFISLPRLKDPVNNAIEEVLKSYGLTSEQIEKLKQTQKFIFILDAYDEIRINKNLLVTNKLEEWNAKIIITCRTQYLHTIENYNQYFMPYENERSVPWLFTEVHLKPFNQTQIEKYLHQYVNHHEVEWKDPKIYLKHIEEIPGLKKLIETPFLLKLAVEAMPEVVKLFAAEVEKQKNLKMTQAKLYDVFVAQWFDRQEKKLIEAKQIKPSENIKARFWEYAKGLSKELFAHNITQIVYEAKDDLFGEAQTETTNPFEKYFDERDPQTRILRTSTLLQQTGKNQYGFLHSSLIEYFVSRDFYETAEPNKELITTQKPELKSPTTWLDKELKKAFNQRLIVKERRLLRFNADRVDEDPSYKKYMFDLVEASKQTHAIQVAAANALTVLVMSNTNLVNLDFSNIAAPYADLSGAMLWGANFLGADLTGANLQSTYLRDVNLSQAILSHHHLGQWSALKLEATVLACAYSLDGRYLAVATGINFRTGRITQGDRLITLTGCNIKLYDGKTRKLLRTLQGHTGNVTCIAFSPNGDLIVSGGLDKSVRIWDLKTGTELRQLHGHTSNVTSIAISPDGKLAAAGSDDKSVHLWNMESGVEYQQLHGHTESVTCVTFSPQGNLLASGSADSSVCLWNVDTGTKSRQLEGHASIVTSVAFSPRGDILASGSYDNNVLLWDVISGEQSKQLEGHTEAVTCIVFLPQGDLLASGSKDNSVRLWDVASGAEYRQLNGHTREVTSVAFALHGNVLTLASGSSDKSVCLWDMTSGAECRQRQKSHTDKVESVAFTQDGNFLASGSYDKSVCLRDVSSGFDYRLIAHAYRVTCVAFSLRENLLASGSEDNTIRLFEMPAGVEHRRLKGHTGSVRSVAFAPEGNLFASAGDDKIIRLWDISTGAECRQLKGNIDQVNSVAFSPKGNRLASGSFDGSIRLWDVASGAEYLQLKGHKSCVSSVAFSPLDNLLASGSFDNSVRLWDVNNGMELWQLQGHSKEVTKIAFSSHGNILASGGEDKSVRLWDVITRACNLTLLFPNEIGSLAWSLQAGISKLAVGFGDAVACFTVLEINKILNARIDWVVMNGQRLDFTNANLTGTIGLNNDQWELMKQLGATGEPGRIVEVEEVGNEIAAVATTLPTKAESNTANKNSQPQTKLSSSPQSFVANIGSAAGAGAMPSNPSVRSSNTSLPRAEIEMTTNPARASTATTNTNATAAETPTNSSCCALL